MGKDVLGYTKGEPPHMGEPPNRGISPVLHREPPERCSHCGAGQAFIVTFRSPPGWTCLRCGQDWYAGTIR